MNFSLLVSIEDNVIFSNKWIQKLLNLFIGNLFTDEEAKEGDNWSFLAQLHGDSSWQQTQTLSKRGAQLLWLEKGWGRNWVRDKFVIDKFYVYNFKHYNSIQFILGQGWSINSKSISG